VQNFTDIEEVIIRRAAEAGKPPPRFRAVLHRRVPRGHEGPERPARDHTIRRSRQHIPEIIGLVERLIDRGYAYAIDGEVYFRTKKAKHSFGILSHRKIEDIVVDAVPQGSRREDPLDFALWKRSKEGEPSWRARGAKAAPVARRMQRDGRTSTSAAPLDIHGGGLDLMFPHHESEAMHLRRGLGGRMGAHVDAQRLSHPRTREDVEEPRKFL